MPYRSYKYSFLLETPNVHNSVGNVLTSAYTVYVDPQSPDTKQWRPGPTLLKEQADTLTYRDYVLSKGFYVVVLPILQGNGNLDESPESIEFHKQLLELNMAENARFMVWFRSQQIMP